MSSPEQRLIALDGLRGLAALIVVVSHFSNRTEAFGFLLGKGAGQLGVLLFFVLSGFLMGWLYREQPFTRENVMGFAQRRFARIAPLFVAVLVLTYAMYHSPLRQFVVVSMPTGAFVETLLLWNGRGIFWTIPVEVQFYAVFPLIWFASARWPRLWLPLTAIAAIALLAAVKLKFPVLLDYGAAFLVGVMVASLKGRPPAVVSNLVFLACLAGLVLLYPGVWRLIGLRAWDPYQSPVHMVVIGGLVWASIRSPIATMVFGNRPARYLGDISFSLYLLHYMAFKVVAVTPLSQNLAVFFISFVVAAVAISAVSHRFLEVPARRWLSKPRAKRSVPGKSASTDNPDLQPGPADATR